MCGGLEKLQTPVTQRWYGTMKRKWIFEFLIFSSIFHTVSHTSDMNFHNSCRLFFPVSYIIIEAINASGAPPIAFQRVSFQFMTETNATNGAVQVFWWIDSCSSCHRVVLCNRNTLWDWFSITGPWVVDSVAAMQTLPSSSTIWCASQMDGAITTWVNAQHL